MSLARANVRRHSHVDDAMEGKHEWVGMQCIEKREYKCVYVVNLSHK